MRCPDCNHSDFTPTEPCPDCQFSGDPALIEEWARLDWLLDEINDWESLGIEPGERQKIQEQYLIRQRDVEITLNLRPVPLNEEEAKQTWPDLFHRETLLKKIPTWFAAGHLIERPTQKLLDQLGQQIEDLLAQLEGHPRPAHPQSDADRLAQTNFLLEAVDYLDTAKGIASPETKIRLKVPLLDEKEGLEIALGLRPRPTPQPAVEPSPTAKPSPAPQATQAQPTTKATKAIEPPPQKPSVPLTERVWRTLLSERTLQAILFLGIFLLFAAALSFVIWDWKNFSAPLRVAIPTLFTVLFFAAGRYIRTKTTLHRSGMALSAIAALLVPIDFYTLYANSSVPPDFGPAFWLLASLACVAAYTIAAYIIKSRFFGYLITAALGSTVLALIQLAHQLTGLSLDWRSAGLSLLALGLMAGGQRGRGAGEQGSRGEGERGRGGEGETRRQGDEDAGARTQADREEERKDTQHAIRNTRLLPHFLSEPFQYVALIAAAVLMLFTLGENFIRPVRYDTLYHAMTVAWWAGGIIFGWGAIAYRSRSLGILTALSLPVAMYFTQSSIFHHYQINPAWHAFGLALLVPVYFLAAYKLAGEQRSRGAGERGSGGAGTRDTKHATRNTQHAVFHQHGRTALVFGLALTAIAALWPLTDLSSAAAAAATHAVLTGSVLMAALLWRQPRYLYGVSLFALTTLTFTLTELGLSFWQLSPGWDTLALAHLIIALIIGRRASGMRSDAPASERETFAGPLVIAGYAIAALALLPPLFLGKSSVLVFALGTWLGMTAWGARLAYIEQPGFVPKHRWAGDIFHWLTALPLPIWLLLLFAEIRPPDASFALALGALAWGMIGLSYWLKNCVQKACHFGKLSTQPERSRRDDLLYPAWYIVGLLTGAITPVAAFLIAPDGFAFPITLAMAGALYLSDAFISRRSWLLAPGGPLLAWGWSLFFERLGVPAEAVTFALVAIVSAYFLGGLWVERKRSPVYTGKFLFPLYLTGHVLTLFALARIYWQPLDAIIFDANWTDAMQLWGAASQLLLGAIYGLYAWGRYKERWAHLAAWLGAAGGGFIAIAYSQGRGSSAAKAALVAVIFVLAERGLRWWGRRRSEWANGPRSVAKQSFYSQIRKFANSQVPLARLAWPLYRRPLLVTGWTVSAVAIGLALLRNLWLLGGGPTQKFWAWMGLLIIVGLYALSAYLFRQVRFVWLASALVFAPWTILTNLGWYTPYRPTTPGYALSWAALAWLLFLLSVFLRRRVGRAYTLPINITAQVLLPFSLLWGIADVDTSRFTFELAIGFYALAAILARREYGPTASRLKLTGFLYPALGLLPVWAVYLLAWLLPSARHEHYGLMLLLFGPLGLATGHWLKRFGADEKGANAYALPAYLTAYASLIVGTMLTAHQPPLLSLTLLYDVSLLLFSAWRFTNPLWLYPAATLTPISMLIALSERGTAVERQGWWLIGLGAVYFGLTAALRRAKLRAYGTAPLVAGFALIALGLPPSSQDQTGALWGYGSAALLYAIVAVWLQQPLLLTPASALAIVPYAIGLQRSSLDPAYYGLALFPGALVALSVGWALDGWQVSGYAGGQVGRWAGEQVSGRAGEQVRLGNKGGFPFAHLLTCIPAYLLNWWGLPLYALGFGLATAAPFFTQGRLDLRALNFLLLMPIFAWGIYRFRLRVYLLAAATAGHLAMISWLFYTNWQHYPAHFWLRFAPVTWLTALAAMYLTWRLDERSPFELRRWWQGWSRPLYLLVGLDFVAAQYFSMAPESAGAGALVTLSHALLITVLSTFLASNWLPYVTAVLGLIFVGQRLSAEDAGIRQIPPALALLSLGYGLLGYALSFIRRLLSSDLEFRAGIRVWEKPLQLSGLALSAGTLMAAAALSLNLLGWTVRAIFGFPFREIVDPTAVFMLVQVFSFLGLLYLSAAFVHRQPRVGYAAVGMLLAAWMLYVFYIQGWAGLNRVQWYAAPAGLYLLVIGWQEWRQGHKSLGRWIDYAAMFLMLGSLFWQTLVLGWAYFALLMLEGLALLWWGSARRLRRFLYAGLIGVVLATVGQLVNAALSFINQWMVYGLIGLLLIVTAVLVERKLEDLKTWQESLEEWE